MRAATRLWRVGATVMLVSWRSRSEAEMQLEFDARMAARHRAHGAQWVSPIERSVDCSKGDQAQAGAKTLQRETRLLIRQGLQDRSHAGVVECIKADVVAQRV